jgi:glycosyltransferase involved in cell wall biosynthesis
MNNDKLFSVVLRTRNEIRNIANFVESYKLQSYEFKELIIVDNYSTDGTREWLEAQGLKYYLKGNERVEQGNYGMLQLAKGRWVGYFDADMYLASNLVASLVRAFQSDCNISGVRIREIVLGISFGSKVRRYEREFYEDTCVDAARAFTRSALVAANGFDLDCFPTPSAEDWDLDRRIAEFGSLTFLSKNSDERHTVQTSNFSKTKGFLSTDDWPCFYHNEAEFNWRWYFKKKIYYSKSLGQYVKKWGSNDSILRKQLGFKYRFLQVFIENKKYKKVLQNPHLMLVLWVQLFVVGVIFSIVRIGMNARTKLSMQ